MTRLPPGTFNKVCELEQAGDVEGARRLYDSHTHPGGYDDDRQFAEALKVANVDWVEMEAIMSRFRALDDLPEGNRAKKVWGHLWDLLPRQLADFWRDLPDPLARGQGRPRGSGPVVSDHLLLDELRQLVDEGAAPTTAAKQLLEQRGVRLTGRALKGRADSLVRLLKR